MKWNAATLQRKAGLNNADLVEKNFLANRVVVSRRIPAPAVQPTIATPRFHRPAKWVKPKGLEKLPLPKPKEVREAKPKRTSTPKPKAHVVDDDPEQWGQYYFRDAILDQLERYFIYLKRMKIRDKEAYNLHHQLGIQILPSSAVRAFDNWREKETEDQLSAWWKETRPAFGAVSYGIDNAGTEEEKYGTADLSPEQWEEAKKNGYDPERVAKKMRELPKHRLITVCGGGRPIKLGEQQFKTAMFWVPKFLYFHKYDKPPAEIQRVVDGDVYTMTIYWDRVSGYSNTFHKRHKGGSPQEYAVCVEKATGEVRVLRQLIHDKIRIKSKKENNGSFSIPNKHWGYPEEHLNWAHRENISPEDFLRRCFMEAALMYETASMGSMIRVAASKGNLTATFGIEIKRTSYFFKDRDIVLTPKGKRARIFHIRRPHVRKTKHGDVGVKLSFPGLKQFTWAGYQISITVPGLDHANLTELNIGSDSLAKGERMPKGSLGSKATGAYLARWIKEGKGAWK